MTKRIIALLLTLCTLLPSLTVHAAEREAEFPDISRCNAIYLYNITSENLLYTHNGDAIIDPGPTVKLMTALVVLENLGDELNRAVVVEERMIAEVYGSNTNLQVGEILTIEQLLNALVVGNSNDAAAVLAYTVAGSVDAFVVQMNAKAASLGASSTVYTNVTGLHDDAQVSTVNDIAKIALYLYKFSVFREIAAKPNYEMAETNMSRPRKIYSRNHFISTATEYKYYTPSINGMNAGGTNEAGYCVVATSSYNNIEYLCIVMGAEQVDTMGVDEEGKEYLVNRDIYSFIIAQGMLWWAYFNYSYFRVLDTSNIICEVPVKLSEETDYIALMPEASLDLYLPNETDISTAITYNWTLNESELTAPVQNGEVVGLITLIYNDTIVGRVNLVAKDNVSRSEWLYILSLAKAFVQSTPFRVTIIAVLAIGALYVLVQSAVLYDRQQKKKRKRPEN